MPEHRPYPLEQAVNMLPGLVLLAVAYVGLWWRDRPPTAVRRRPRTGQDGTR